MLFDNRFDLDQNFEFLTSSLIFAQNLLINILIFLYNTIARLRELTRTILSVRYFFRCFFIRRTLHRVKSIL